MENEIEVGIEKKEEKLAKAVAAVFVFSRKEERGKRGETSFFFTLGEIERRASAWERKAIPHDRFFCFAPHCCICAVFLKVFLGLMPGSSKFVCCPFF